MGIDGFGEANSEAVGSPTRIGIPFPALQVVTAGVGIDRTLKHPS